MKNITVKSKENDTWFLKQQLESVVYTCILPHWVNILYNYDSCGNNRLKIFHILVWKIVQLVD